MATVTHWVEPCGCEEKSAHVNQLRQHHILVHAGGKKYPGFNSASFYLYSDSIKSEAGWDADGAPVA